MELTDSRYRKKVLILRNTGIDQWKGYCSSPPPHGIVGVQWHSLLYVYIFPLLLNSTIKPSLVGETHPEYSVPGRDLCVFVQIRKAVRIRQSYGVQSSFLLWNCVGCRMSPCWHAAPGLSEGWLNLRLRSIALHRKFPKRIRKVSSRSHILYASFTKS